MDINQNTIKVDWILKNSTMLWQGCIKRHSLCMQYTVNAHSLLTWPMFQIDFRAMTHGPWKSLYGPYDLTGITTIINRVRFLLTNGWSKWNSELLTRLTQEIQIFLIHWDKLHKLSIVNCLFTKFFANEPFQNVHKVVITHIIRNAETSFCISAVALFTEAHILAILKNQLYRFKKKKSITHTQHRFGDILDHHCSLIPCKGSHIRPDIRLANISWQ